MKISRAAVVVILFLCVSILLAACSRDGADEAPTAEPAPLAGDAQVATTSSEPTREAEATATEARPTATPTASNTPTPLPPTASPQPTTTEPPTAVPTLAAFPIDASIDEIAADLEGLSIDDFFEVSYRHLLVRNPEFLTEVGLAESLGLRNDRLSDLSEEAAEETNQIHRVILDKLRSYDREALTGEQQISYDIYEWYLDDLIRDYDFRDHHYLIRHFYSGYHANLERLFMELHPLEDKEDVEDYVARLAQVDTQVDQVIDALRRSQEAGIVLPRFSLLFTRRQLAGMLQMTNDDPSTIRRGSVPLFQSFNQRLSAVEGLSGDERSALRDQALNEIEQSYIPAILALIDMVDEQLLVATDDVGVWTLPDGEAFYEHVLLRETTTYMTAAEIHQLGLEEVDRIHGEMRAIFDELGYPAGAALSELIPRAIEEAGRVPGGMEGAVAEYEALLAEIDERLYEVLDVRPQMELVVMGMPGIGGYYTPGSADGSRPGVFFAGAGDAGLSRFEMATVAYHEAVPGHHLQDALAKEMDLPTFRRMTFFNGHGEGWALYAERLAWELGLYDDDPYGNLGRLYMELLRAVRMVADTGIHTMGWTREEARAYMTEAMGGDRWAGEVDRYIVWPAQSTEYMVGMLEILEMRQKAMDALGEAYDPLAFHRVVLLNGSVPLTVLETVVDDYIETTQGQ